MTSQDNNSPSPPPPSDETTHREWAEILIDSGVADGSVDTPDYTNLSDGELDAIFADLSSNLEAVVESLPTNDDAFEEVHPPSISQADAIADLDSILANFVEKAEEYPDLDDAAISSPSLASGSTGDDNASAAGDETSPSQVEVQTDSDTAKRADISLTMEDMKRNAAARQAELATAMQANFSTTGFFETAAADLFDARKGFDEKEHDLIDSLEEQTERLAGIVGSKKKLEELQQRIVSKKSEMPPGDALQGPLGEASPSFDKGGLPTVLATQSGDKWQIDKTTSTNAENHESWINFEVGKTQDCGMIVRLENGSTLVVQVSSDDKKPMPHIECPEASDNWKTKMLVRGLSRETHAQIVLRELEHLCDFVYAYRVGPEALAAAINEVANSGAIYDSKEKAIDALIVKLSSDDLKVFVPQKPYEDDAWLKRASTVTNKLMEFSSDRDNGAGKTHWPCGYRGKLSGNVVFIEPIPKSISMKTEKMISLKRIDPVYSGNADPNAPIDDMFKPGAKVKIKNSKSVEFYEYDKNLKKPENTSDPFTDLMGKGQVAEVSAPSNSAKLHWLVVEFVHYDTGFAFVELHEDDLEKA